LCDSAHSCNHLRRRANQPTRALCVQPFAGLDLLNDSHHDLPSGGTSAEALNPEFDSTAETAAAASAPSCTYMHENTAVSTYAMA